VLFGALVLMASSGCGEDLPVVARGRYVEIATDRDDPVCAGTVAHLDRFIEGVFDVLGETPPDRIFVRSEWPRDAVSPFARLEGDRVLLRSPFLVDEHELVHAVHLQAWPRSARFLHEGLAVLIQSHRPYQAVDMSHFSRSGLDELLGAETLAPGRYAAAWFIVSQIVHDHGFEGLRELWHRIPAGASTQQVRDAYLEIHGRPIGELIEPWLDDGPNGPTPGGRMLCSYTVCAGERHGWVEDRWVGSAPVGCEDDPNAVGSDLPPDYYGHEVGTVWRDYMLENATPVLPPRFSDGVTAILARCGFQCPWSGAFYVGPEAPHSFSTFSGGVRLEVRTLLEALPSDQPGTLELQHDPEYVD
jgi:hypothetical protein